MVEVREGVSRRSRREGGLMLLVVGISGDGQTTRQLLPQSLKGSNRCCSCPLHFRVNRNRPRAQQAGCKADLGHNFVARTTVKTEA